MIGKTELKIEEKFDSQTLENISVGAYFYIANDVIARKVDVSQLNDSKFEEEDGINYVELIKTGQIVEFNKNVAVRMIHSLTITVESLPAS